MAVENDKISFYGGVAFLDGGQAAGKLLTSDATGNVSWQSPTTTYGSLLTASGFKTPSGTSSQFLKADGSVDSSTYLTSSGAWTSGSTQTGLTGDKATSGSITAASLIRSGGTSSQFLKADGSVDSADYIPKTSASLSAGTIVAGKYLGLDASNNVVLGAVSGGGSTFTGTVTPGDSYWSGNTNFSYTATVTGATTTKPAFASLHPDLVTALLNAGCDYSILATCTSANTVRVVVRVTNYVSLPSNKTIYVGAF